MWWTCLTVLWAPDEVLADPAKAAAVRNFVPLWARGQVWAWEHTDQRRPVPGVPRPAAHRARREPAAAATDDHEEKPNVPHA
ncbi:hypothetical protein [Streptomyces sp. A5-4]|uniref:hypothetical protein n=1 Tax=Streptomyces sp. A5-4 TaxID=3384771 RepID=UPI003DAA4504